MKSLMKDFLVAEDGAQMAEYALLLVLIAILLVAASLYLSGVIRDAFEAVGNCIANNTDCPTTPSS